MPVRNIVKYRAVYMYYHVYNRGHNKSALFLDKDDYVFFEFLLKRVFGKKQLKSPSGWIYPWFGDKVELLAYCLMPNHFHLLVHQRDAIDGVSRAMQSLACTYSMYFNRKYKHRGSVYESTFKSVPVFKESYYLHITRYIHLNPKEYTSWPYSSYADYLNINKRSWINTERILALFNDKQDYKNFAESYEPTKNEIDKLKYELADYGESY